MNQSPHDPYQLPPQPSPLGDGFTPTNDERNFAMIAHVSGIAGIFAGGLLGFVGPLIIYLMKKDESPYVASQAKEALNFQITLLLVSVGCVFLFLASCGVFFPIVFVPVVLQVIFGVIAALAVRDGSNYQYPMNVRFLQ